MLLGLIKGKPFLACISYIINLNRLFMKRNYFLLILLLIIGNSYTKESSNTETPKGILYIIGGAKRPAAMVDEIIDISELKNGVA